MNWCELDTGTHPDADLANTLLFTQVAALIKGRNPFTPADLPQFENI